MRNGSYILYPEAREKLDSSGITNRVRDKRSKYEIGINAIISRSEILDITRDMEDRKIFEEIPKSVANDFFKKMDYLFKKMDEHKWKIKRFSGILEEEVEDEDFLFMLGSRALDVLKRKEVFDYSKFGFRNITDFTGSVAALIENEIRSGPGSREGYIWQTKFSDGRIIENEVTGNTHCDLSIYQTDITPYETFDPIGNQVSYRPELEQDRMGIFAYHSTEPSLLSAVLKWVEQCNLPSKSLENKATQTIAWAKALGQGGGTCTEHFFGDSDRHQTRMVLGEHDVPLWKLDKNNRCEKVSHYGLFASSDFYYGIYLNEFDELVFASDSREKESPKIKAVTAKFLPSDVDHLIKGLLYQSAKGLGRTSARQLIDILEYSFSEEYKMERDEFKKSLRK